MPRSLPTALVVAAAVLPPCPAQDRAPDKSLPSADMAAVAAAYAAKVAASAIFVSGRTLESVLAEELAPTRPLEALIRPLLKFEVDRDAGTVTATLGASRSTAVCTRNLGCTLARPDVPIATLRARGAPGLANSEPDPAYVDWPLGNRLPDTPPPDIDRAAVERAVAAAFTEPAKGTPIHTRAVVVLHRGQLVAERYAEGYHAAMPLPGWSMTKTLTHALIGVRVQQGSMHPGQPTENFDGNGVFSPVNSLDNLLRMTGNRAWNESYDDPASDVLAMLFRSTDHSTVYTAKPLSRPRGERFLYSSGATNLACRVLRASFDTESRHLAFPREHLFAPLGMRTAVMETDPSGTFVGSSYGFASARDWARLGLLYCDGGEFAGKRIVAKEWIDGAFVASPASDGKFGRHLWLDADPDGDGPASREWPELPSDLGYMSGHEGQYCVVIPSERLVVVRLGCTKNGGFPLRALLSGVLTALRP
ncbi:MAG: serine hydrolase [Planctomycetota bacterium]